MILRPEDMYGPASDPFNPNVEGSGTDREVVVWVDAKSDLMAILNFPNGEYPRLASLSEEVAKIIQDKLVVEDAHRLSPKWLTRDLTDSDRRKRCFRMDTIRPLIEATPDIFDPVQRGRLIGEAHRSSGVARNTIKKWLHRYYRFGRCGNAVLDQYQPCGHRKKGVVNDTWAPLGRPPQIRRKRTENITAAIQNEFSECTAREIHEAGESFKISGAFRRWINEKCYVDAETDGLRTKRLHDRYGEFEPANYGQFYRWFRSTGQHEASSRKILGGPIYEKDNRAIRSTSTFETWGPGARFQIDATVANHYVTSDLRRDIPLGRPYLYFVRDVWSRAICGYYVGFQPPSELTAGLALMNAFSPKADLLQRFGFDPAQKPWPMEHVCGALLHDGGEITGRKADWQASSLAMTFEQASAERGDLKGAIETMFHWSDVEWSREIPGHVRPRRYRAASKRSDVIDMAASGVLHSIAEFERKVIEFILNWNNFHVLSQYDADRDLVAAGIPRIPMAMWEWGIANRGEPRKFDPDYIRFQMMPREKATVYPSGIKFEGAFFTSEELRPLQSAAAQSGRTQSVQISHDLTGDRIFCHSDNAPKGYFVCNLADRDRWRAGLCLEDSAAIDDDRKATEWQATQEENRNIAERSLRAIKSAPQRDNLSSTRSLTRSQAKSESKAALREHKKQERSNSFVPSGASPPPVENPQNSVVPFKRQTSRYSAPSVEEIDDAEY